jgi:cell division septum initiation protein DivIVA
MKIVYPEEIMTAKIKELEKEVERLKAEVERLTKISDSEGDALIDCEAKAVR